MAKKDTSHAPDMTKKEYNLQQQAKKTAEWERTPIFFQLMDFYCSLLGIFLITQHDLKLKFS